MAIKLITGPTAEPISVDEAKHHLRVDHADDDLYIASLIVAAREGAEHITSRALLPQTWELALDEFPCIAHRQLQWRNHRYIADAIRIPKPPLAAITSVKYIDDAGDLQTIASDAYLLDAHSEPARIMPGYGASWPVTRIQANAVLIRFTCGYENAAAVPQMIKNWMLLRIGMLYENRESVTSGAPLQEVPHVDRLLDPYRFWTV